MIGVLTLDKKINVGASQIKTQEIPIEFLDMMEAVEEEAGAVQRQNPVRLIETAFNLEATASLDMYFCPGRPLDRVASRREVATSY